MTETILPHQMPEALDRAGHDLQILSLDCFDTLLWRDCHAPADLFAALPGLATGQRAFAEGQARKIVGALKQRSEVSLGEIYAQAFPRADSRANGAAIEAELAAEARHCFAFGPTVELMRRAKERGLKVIIVSDTYLSADQLRCLISNSAGEEVASLIDRVFASSDAGISKSQGLLARALKVMKVPAAKVLHIGDNAAADYEGARALGIPALHLVQFDEKARQRLRFERACQQLYSETGAIAQGKVAGLQPHRALLARDEPTIKDSAKALGFSVLGPVFHAYEAWLREEARLLQEARGGTVHRLFMLRDGYLPRLVHEAELEAGLGEGASSAEVEISRYVATAASLTTRKAYEQHLGSELGLNPATLARQMLFNDDEIEALIGDPKTDAEREDKTRALYAELRKGQRQKLTLRRARAMADRLVSHVRRACNPQPGDTLMLVDLGYNGSAQNAIDGLLQERLGVHVAGRYLIAREKLASGLDKTGLIDPRHFSAGFLEAICANVAVVEQLATCELGSVIDFTNEGEPVRRESGVKGQQSAVRESVQRGVVRFANEAARAPVIRASDESAQEAWREGAAGALARFLFLPHESELAVIKSFEHDVNLGSERMVALFDTAEASASLKRRGLFYMKGSSRMFLPAELAREDMTTRLAWLVQKQFGLGLTYADYAPRALNLPVFFTKGDESAARMIEARPTHDGFFSARIPLGEEGLGVALQLGAAMEWVEVASVTRSPVASLKSADERSAPRRVAVQYDGMKEHAPGILEASEKTALMFALPASQSETQGGAQMLEVVFRPIRLRPEAAAALSAGTAEAHVSDKARNFPTQSSKEAAA